MENPRETAGELESLGRRQLLRSSALAVAGLATVSSIEVFQLPPAVAQDAGSVSKFQLFKATRTPVYRDPSGLQLCRLFYTFQFQLQGRDAVSSARAVPCDPGLVGIFRSPNANCEPTGDRLQAALQRAPFRTLDDYLRLTLLC
jgi:hypothetical protein